MSTVKFGGPSTSVGWSSTGTYDCIGGRGGESKVGTGGGGIGGSGGDEALWGTEKSLARKAPLSVATALASGGGPASCGGGGRDRAADRRAREMLAGWIDRHAVSASSAVPKRCSFCARARARGSARAPTATDRPWPRGARARSDRASSPRALPPWCPRTAGDRRASGRRRRRRRRCRRARRRARRRAPARAPCTRRSRAWRRRR